MTGYRDIVVPAGDKALLDRLQFNAVIRSHGDAHYDEVLEGLGLGRRSKRLRVRIGLARLLRQWCAERFGQEGLQAMWSAWKAERLRAGRDLFAVREVATKWVVSRGGSSEDGLAWWAYLWARKDAHLHQYACNIRRRAEHQRDALYRAEAIKLATRYTELVTASTLLSGMKRKPDADQESDGFKHLRGLRQAVAPGRCREILREVFGARDRKSTRLNSSHIPLSRMPSSA